MSIRTLTDLNAALANELAWRRKELSEINALLHRSNNNPSGLRTVLRCGVALLYAHWEGFIKQATSNYLEYISYQNLCYKDLKLNLLAFATRTRLNSAIQTKGIEKYIDISRFFRDEQTSISEIPFKDAIRTSNLNSEEFREIVMILGLKYEDYAIDEKLIDERLLKNRNNVAHGNYLEIDQKDYSDLHKTVLGLMVLFRNQLENLALLQSYRELPRQEAS